MDPAIYKFLHYIGIFLMLSGLGGYLFAEKPSRFAAISHGIGLALLLVGGFGMQKFPAIGWSWWFIVKVVIWALLGATVIVTKRKLLPPAVTWLLVIVLASVAAWLGYSHSLIMRP